MNNRLSHNKREKIIQFQHKHKHMKCYCPLCLRTNLLQSDIVIILNMRFAYSEIPIFRFVTVGIELNKDGIVLSSGLSVALEYKWSSLCYMGHRRLHKVDG